MMGFTAIDSDLSIKNFVTIHKHYIIILNTFIQLPIGMQIDGTRYC